jgi:hypothetical protein
MGNANSGQVGGDHYKVTPFQHWDFAAEAGLGYFEGQITKYLDRYARKNGLQDIQKAGHFTAKLLELARAGARPAHPGADLELVTRFFAGRNSVHPAARSAITMVSLWATPGHLERAQSLISELELDYSAKAEGSAPTPAYVNQDAKPIDLRSLADMNAVQVDALISPAEADATFGGTESEGGLL